MDTLSYLISKIVWLLISPEAILLLFSIAGVFCLFLDKTKFAKYILAFSITCFSLIAFLPVDEWLAYPLEKRFITNPELPEHIDGVIVLGGSLSPTSSTVWDQVEINSSGERVFAFISLAKRFPDAKLVFTGGNGSLSQQDFKEADIAQYFVNSLGISNSRVIYERNSRNTYENVIYSKSLAQPDSGENWLLVTSAIHMPRAVGLFCKQDWPVIPYPVDHNTIPGQLLRVEFNFSENLNFFTRTIHEWIGLLAHRLSGKTNSFFPTTC
jgi:uncharacterized SAM-binding protein YcdF (DUF218 family)